jgi:hypothetical protein
LRGRGLFFSPALGGSTLLPSTELRDSEPNQTVIILRKSKDGIFNKPVLVHL